jgi:hypothetical protein
LIQATLKVDERFKKRVKARYERFDVQGGVLEDKPHHEPKPAKRAKKKQKKQRVQSKQQHESGADKAKKKTKAKKKKASLFQKVKGKIKKAATTKADKAKKMRAAHRARGLGTLEGGPVRLQKPKTWGTVAEVGEAIRKIHGIDYLRTPVRRENSPEMKELRKAFFDLLRGRNKNYSAVEAKFRAVLRIPILKARYGRNTSAAARVKTFNRKLIDTGQFFKAIIARVRVRKNV